MTMMLMTMKMIMRLVPRTGSHKVTDTCGYGEGRRTAHQLTTSVDRQQQEGNWEKTLSCSHFWNNKSETLDEITAISLSYGSRMYIVYTAYKSIMESQ